MARRAAIFPGFLWLVVALAAFATGTACAADSSPRQYYGAWHHHSSQNYLYRPYYYKASPDDIGYRHHYVIYYPSRPDHYYFYNPYTKTFWGRCSSKVPGTRGYDREKAYSLLPPAARKSTIEEIPESSFPQPGRVPTVPESTDGLPLDLPPDDAPTDAASLPAR